MTWQGELAVPRVAFPIQDEWRGNAFHHEIHRGVVAKEAGEKRAQVGPIELPRVREDLFRLGHRDVIPP